MSINDAAATERIVHNTKNVSEIVSQASNAMNSIVSQTVGSIGNWRANVPLTGDGYPIVGMNTEEIGTFETAMNRYQEELYAITADLQRISSSDVYMAFKGDVTNAIDEFLRATKDLIDHYIQTLTIEVNEVKEAATNYHAAVGSIANDVAHDADTLRAQSNNLSID